jgi:hypothetical protein
VTKRASFIYKLFNLKQKVSNINGKENIEFRALKVVFLIIPQARLGKYSFPICHRYFGSY